MCIDSRLSLMFEIGVCIDMEHFLYIVLGTLY